MQVQVVDQTTHPPICRSSVGLDMQIGSSPPANKPEQLKLEERKNVEVLHLFRWSTHTPRCREAFLGRSLSEGAEIKMSAIWAKLQARSLRVLRDFAGSRSLLGQTIGKNRKMATQENQITRFQISKIRCGPGGSVLT